VRYIVGVLIGVPGVALLGTAPWWLNNIALVETLIRQTVHTTAGWQTDLLFYLLLPPAIIARFFDIKNRTYAFMLVWWLAAELLPVAGAVILLPGILLVGDGLLWLYDVLPQRLRTLSRQYVYGLIALAGGALLAVNVSLSQQTLAGLEMSASPDDVAVLREFALYAPDDAYLHNPPETPRALPLAERAVSNFSPQNPQLLANLPSAEFGVSDAATHYYLPDGATLPSDLTLDMAFSQGGAAIYMIVQDEDVSAGE
jgi:hypothetical protein